MTLTSPSMDNSSAELLPGGDSPLNRRMTETLLASLTEHERQVILNIPAAQSPEDLRMFARYSMSPALYYLAPRWATVFQWRNGALYCVTASMTAGSF